MARNGPEELAKILMGGHPKYEQQAIPTQAQEGVIQRVENGKATFTIPEYDAQRSYGPAAFCRTDNPPQPGDKCLVVFVGNGIDRAWVVAWAVNS